MFRILVVFQYTVVLPTKMKEVPMSEKIGMKFTESLSETIGMKFFVVTSKKIKLQKSN